MTDMSTDSYMDNPTNFEPIAEIFNGKCTGREGGLTCKASEPKSFPWLLFALSKTVQAGDKTG